MTILPENVGSAEPSTPSGDSRDAGPSQHPAASPPVHASDLPRGFSFGSAAAKIKPSGRRDVSLIVCDPATVAAGVYTTNHVVAAPVLWCRDRTPMKAARAVITVSGNANACTGERGRADAAEMASRTAEAIRCEADDVLVMSTGVIGRFLPMDHVRSGIASAADGTDSTPEAFEAAADGICTTDQFRKVAATTVSLSGGDIRLAGMCKGAGMIHPRMATFLAVLMTDAELDPDRCQAMLSRVVNSSFNRMSVDGHTSTNDTCLLLASGGASITLETPEDERAIESALIEITQQMARQVVADGEGARHFLSVVVEGAPDDPAAEKIAETVAASPLVKTAITGGDPNWGRIVSAVGYAGVPVKENSIRLWIQGHAVFDGQPVAYDEREVSEAMQSSAEVHVRIVVGDGPGTADFFASDLTVDYVNFNSLYTT